MRPDSPFLSGRRSRRLPWCLPYCLLLVISGLVSGLSYAQKGPSPEQIADLQKMETARQANDRITELALAESVRQHDYVIGSGDLLGIEVFDVPELSREVRVNESGFVALPLIPVKVQAGGLTPFQFQDKLAELLEANGLVTHPQITVTVKEQHSEPITVIGAVKMPLTVQATHQMSLLQVLSQAGGIADDAGSKVLITRVKQPDPNASSGDSQVGNNPTVDTPSGDTPSPDSTAATPAPLPGENRATITIDLNDLLDSGDPKFNIPLIGGDVVTVPRAGVIYAVGAVQRPGGFVMETDRQQLTVLKVVSLAGGLTPTAKAGNAVILRQPPGSSQRQQLTVDVKKILALKSDDIALQRNDILYVPDSSGKHALRRTAEVAIAIATGAAIIRVE